MEDSITLIIKAANQSVPDHRMDVNSDWTILQVKDHLSSAHPSRPRVDEQRLIYSGQLLLDELKLRSVLRHPTENNSYTIHLVCSPPRMVPGQATATSTKLSLSPLISPLRTAEGRSSDSLPSSSAMTVPSNEVSGSGGTANASVTSVTTAETSESTDGLRRRVTSTNRDEVSAATPQGIEAGYPIGGGVFQATADPIQQMAAMQQIYANYVAYVQYMQMGGMGTMPWPQQMFHHVPTTQSNPSSSSTISSPTTTAPVAAVEQDQQPQLLVGDTNDGAAAGGANPAPPQPQPQIRMNAQGGEVEDDDENEGMGRDWLDWVYVLSRMVVLLSVVYFYSTISRFMVVVCIAMLLYLYQAGWFRPVRRVENNNDVLNVADPVVNEEEEEDDRNNNINNNNNNNDVPQGEGLIVENQQQQNQGGNGIEGDEADRITDRGIGEDELQARQSLLALSWTFLTTFFTSLIPEQPQVI